MMMMMEDYEKRSTEMTAKLLLLLLLMAWFLEGLGFATYWKLVIVGAALPIGSTIYSIRRV